MSGRRRRRRRKEEEEACNRALNFLKLSIRS
jgi:hypothetical protein